MQVKLRSLCGVSDRKTTYFWLLLLLLFPPHQNVLVPVRVAARLRRTLLMPCNLDLIVALQTTGKREAARES